MALTASSLCIGRCCSRGHLSASATLAASNRPNASPLFILGSWRRPAVNLYLGVLVQGALGAALGVEPEVAGFGAFGINESAFVSLKIFAVGAHSPARAVVLVVVKQGANVLHEIRVVSDLDDNVMINFGGVVRVPEHDGKKRLRAAQIHL